MVFSWATVQNDIPSILQPCHIFLRGFPFQKDLSPSYDTIFYRALSPTMIYINNLYEDRYGVNLIAFRAINWCSIAHSLRRLIIDLSMKIGSINKARFSIERFDSSWRKCALSQHLWMPGILLVVELIINTGVIRS